MRNEWTIIESFDAVLLFLANLGLGLDNVPELNVVILNLLNADRIGNVVGTRQLFNARLELAQILPVDFRINDLTLPGNFGVRRGKAPEGPLS